MTIIAFCSIVFQVSKLVPKLVAKRNCVNEPREVCVRLRVNPRTVKRPVIKQWCSDGTVKDSDLDMRANREPEEQHM